MNDVLERIERWFRDQLDGEWEHHHGIQIETCDNPGWIVRVSVVGTELAAKPFTPVSLGVDANRHPVASRWLHCDVCAGVWVGAGDETKLAAILTQFLEWAVGPS